MKHAVARIIKSVVPCRHWTTLQSVRGRSHQLRWLKERGVVDIAKRFADVNGLAVLHGPFAGMRYPLKSVLTRHSVPMLLGSYERELHGIVELALGERYDRVIDIGSAEGYYAVGFALKGKSPVVAFDTDFRELRLCREMAEINGVAKHLTGRGWCSAETLGSLAENARCFVLSDCEGYEAELFDRATLDRLRRSDILVELHGHAYEVLVKPFSRTHDVQMIETSARGSNDYAELACLGSDAARAVAEYRPADQRWLFAKARM
jgi:hypothetical protein